MAEETKEAQETTEATAKREVNDWSTHSYGGLGSLHDSKKLLQNPKAEACTFATMKRRAAEQRAWRAMPEEVQQHARKHYPVDPRAVAGGTELLLGQTSNTRLVTTYLDTTYTFFAVRGQQPGVERTEDKPLVNIYMLRGPILLPYMPRTIIQLTEGEYVFELAEDTPPVTLTRFPLLKNDSEGNYLELMDNSSRKLRTCAACGQVWRRSMKKCAGCGEVPYCSQVCQRHHWSSHKAACKRARSQRKATPEGVDRGGN